MYRATFGYDGLAHVADDGGQAVGAYVGMCLIENRVGCTMIVKQLHHPLHVASLLTSREEFSVGESA